MLYLLSDKSRIGFAILVTLAAKHVEIFIAKNKHFVAMQPRSKKKLLKSFAG